MIETYRNGGNTSPLRSRDLCLWTESMPLRPMFHRSFQTSRLSVSRSIRQVSFSRAMRGLVRVAVYGAAYVHPTSGIGGEGVWEKELNRQGAKDAKSGTRFFRPVSSLPLSAPWRLIRSPTQRTAHAHRQRHHRHEERPDAERPGGDGEAVEEEQQGAQDEEPRRRRAPSVARRGDEVQHGRQDEDDGVGGVEVRVDQAAHLQAQ